MLHQPEEGQQKPQAFQTAAEKQDEARKIRRLQLMVHMVLSVEN